MISSSLPYGRGYLDARAGILETGDERKHDAVDRRQGYIWNDRICIQ